MRKGDDQESHDHKSLRRLVKLRPQTVPAASSMVFVIFALWWSAFHVDLANTTEAQGPDLDYSRFIHSSQRHASLACTGCHERTADNSSLPRFPGHKACTGCHLGQFTTPAAPMCLICHTDTSSGKPPLRDFPGTFKEAFNVKFDHAQHLTPATRPKNGCSGCHTFLINRGVALAIPASLGAHSVCYSCHTHTSKAANGKEIASCGVCHDEKAYSRTTTNARSFRLSFSHAKHSAREHLSCSDCHRVTANLPQSRQVTSPAGFQHFPTSRGQSCATCHNGKRTFGGDLGFRDCRRCHSRATFGMAG
ncbi:MAG: cytochrome c3 family protein [Pyrinomonadaceae bacterium]